jgi:hypothetical protein
MAKAAAPFRTNPSAIARYFFHDCERFLYYSAATPGQRRREGLPTPEFDHSPLVAAVLDSGAQWEKHVVEHLLKGRVVVCPGGGELHVRRLPPEQTLRCLRNEPAGRFLYQATLVPPPSFYERYGLDPALVAISDNHPDLIAVLPGEDGRRKLRVIDLKRGEALKLAHRVQVLLYALELQALLDEAGIDSAEADLDQGAVWLGNQPEPETFRLADFRPHLERFLRNDLGRILAAGADAAHWHLYDRCEWCEFFDHCRDEMRASDDVSRLVQLTSYGKRHLRDEAGVRSLTQLGGFLKRADADEVLDRCASLAGQRHRLQARVAALGSGEPSAHGAAAPDLPQGENVAVFLTLQKEPLSQSVYLAGVHVTAREDVRREVFSPQVAAQLVDAAGKSVPRVWVAATPGDTASVLEQLIDLLDDLFHRLHEYNARRPEWKDKLSLQAYVHTEAERALFCAALREALEKSGLAEKATTLLFHFQGPELMQASRHPESEVAYPIVVLLNAVTRLLALPVEVSYTLPEMLEALGSSFPYTRKDYFHFPLGHGLRAEALHAAWFKGQTGNLDEIERQARLYLYAVSALLRAVRERAGQYLFAWPPRFTLPTGAGVSDPVLSRLMFFARYESLLRCLAVREARAEARPTQTLLGHAIELRAFDASEMEVVGDLRLEPEANGFLAWLLVRDSEEGRRAQVEYADYGHRSQPHGGPESEHRAVVGVHEVSASGGRTLLRLNYGRPFKGRAPARGERFLLYQRFTDFTTDPVVKLLAEMDRTPAADCLFRRLLRDPEGTAEPLPLPRRAESAAVRGEDALGFTPSQREAYRAIRAQRVTAVWGPPGTGKTHFLAATIVGLALAHRRAGLPFRVLVTAFTHAAIENLLRKIACCREELAPEIDLGIGKAKYWQHEAGAELGSAVPEWEMAGWLEDGDLAVLGATAYSCLKQRDQLPGFDLVVIDEASQVRVPEAAVAARLVAPSGRLVLAGDHLQLPPIIAGAYPETPPAAEGTTPVLGRVPEAATKTAEPLLHRSIFEAVCPRQVSDGRVARGSRVVRQLLENFRMNDVLTDFAARLLYGPGYRCFDAEVAGRRLAFKAGRKVDPLVRACLDPAFPLVVVVLEGVRTGQANPVEADLVAQLTVALRDGLRDADGKPYANDEAFFRRGVFIVSPHHAQIRAVRQELAKVRAWRAPPFVDTVDKIQGQEADAVLVSYGVADPELALREAEFIYGLNRLNVALTRARSKCVLCLPRPLLEASPQVLDVEPAAVGLAFMRRLVSAMEENGEELQFEGDGVEARVLRAGPLAQPRPVGEPPVRVAAEPCAVTEPGRRRAPPRLG